MLRTAHDREKGVKLYARIWHWQRRAQRSLLEVAALDLLARTTSNTIEWKMSYLMCKNAQEIRKPSAAGAHVRIRGVRSKVARASPKTLHPNLKVRSSIVRQTDAVPMICFDGFCAWSDAGRSSCSETCTSWLRYEVIELKMWASGVW